MAQYLVTQVNQDQDQEPADECCCSWRCICRFLCCCHFESRGSNQTLGVGSVELPKQTKYLLPTIPDGKERKKCLVLDLDETLVHSSFKPIPDADFKIEINLEGTIHRVYVRKRPFVDKFLEDVGKKWEVVIFTASLAKYADPLLDILDRGKVVSTRLFREGCVQHYGNYVKDLTHLGRPLKECVIVDNSPFSYMFQPNNAIPITSWFNDRNDRQLEGLMPYLDKLLKSDDFPSILEKKEWPFLRPQQGQKTGDE